MPPLNLHLYRTPESDVNVGQTVVVHGVELPTWQVTHIERSQFDCSFEQVEENLSRLPRMFIEPDGSFVWRGQGDLGSWQLDGMLYDFGGRLSRVEITGQCPFEQWKMLTQDLHPNRHLIAYLVDHHCFVNAVDLEDTWR